MLASFQSPSAAERLTAAGAFLERVPAATELLVVGATRDAADDVARRVTAARGATFGLHRASLPQLAVRLAAVELARLGVAPATALGELRLGGVAPGPLEKLDGRARDVAELARRFEAQLEDGKIADRAALLEIATRALEGDAGEPLRRMPMVLLDVPITGPLERTFIQTLTRDSPAALITVAAGGTTRRSRRLASERVMSRRTGAMRSATSHGRRNSCSRRMCRRGATRRATSSSSPRRARGARPRRSALLLTLAPVPLYRSYAAARGLGALDPLEDQAWGGVVMWGLGGLIEMLAVLALLYRSLGAGARGRAMDPGVVTMPRYDPPHG